MSRLFENFLSNQWNIYGLQVLAGSLMVIVLHSFLTIFQMCIVGLCVYLIAISQRILGVRYGMIFSQLQRERMDFIVKEAKKRIKKNKDKKNDKGNV